MSIIPPLLLNRLEKHPKRIFLIDGLGAILSAFCLGVPLVYWQDKIGMPTSALYPLSLIAGLFALYSGTCFLFLVKNWGKYLWAIACANLLYCFLTMGLLIEHFHELSAMGFLYFFMEIIVILVLVFVEFTLFSTIRSTKGS
ncbi:MAG: hypothetical protein NWR72_11955 [Bacteroidia bacterium]|nr:hypothetical protein [Bacteroidia bacterium]